MNAITMPTARPVSNYRVLGWGASAVLHGGAVALLVFGLPYRVTPPPAPEIIPLEMAALPTAPALAEAEPTPAMEEAQAVAPEATSAAQVPSPSLAMTAPEAITTAQPPPPDAAAATPPAEMAPPPPDVVQAVEPELQQAAEPDVVPLEAIDIPLPPPAPPPPPVQAARQPAPTPPRPVEPRHDPKPAPAPAAPQYSQAPPAPVTTAPAPAAAPSAAPGRLAVPPVDYQTRVMAALVRAKRYPQRARLRGSEGKLAVTFTFRRDGTLVGWRLASSSGDPDLDQAAGEMIERAAPLPPMPASYPGESATMTVPVDFSLR